MAEVSVEMDQDGPEVLFSVRKHTLMGCIHGALDTRHLPFLSSMCHAAHP